MKYDSNGNLLVSGSSGGGGGGGATEAEILSALNNADSNTANSTIYDVELAQDDNGLYLIRYNKQANTSASITLAGAPYVPVNPRISSTVKAISASFGSVLTSVVGANYVPLTAGACTEVLLLNLDASAVDLEIRRGATGTAIILPFGTSILLEAITDSFDIQVRRADVSSIPAPIRFERRTR